MIDSETIARACAAAAAEKKAENPVLLDLRGVSGFTDFFLICSGIAFSIGHMVSVPATGGVYTEALIGEPQALNPIDAPSNDADADLTSLIYSGLFRMQGLKTMPDLAESYSWSADGKTLDVKIRRDARFHDGESVTADDVQFTVESIQDSTRESQLAPLFRGVTTNVVNDHEIQFVMDQPDITFLQALCVGILPANLWQDIPTAGARIADINLKPIGSGPYLVKSFTRDRLGAIKSYTLERWEGYYGIKPHIKDITFQFYTDLQTASDAIKSDLVDGLAFISPSDQERFKSSTRWTTSSLQIPQETIAFFNLKDPLMQDIRIRRALSLATSKPEIVQALNGHASEVNGPYPFSSATSSSFNIEEARQELQTAGWVTIPDSNIRVYQKPVAGKSKTPIPPPSASSTKLSISIVVPDEPNLTKVAEILKRQWSLLGAQIDIQTLDAKDVLRLAVHDRKSQVTLLNVLLGSDQDMFPVWWSGEISDRGMNISGLSDKDVDTLITQTESATSTDALAKAQTKLDNAITSKYVADFLVRPQYGYIISTRVKGVPATMQISQPANRFQDIGDWYIKTGLRWK